MSRRLIALLAGAGLVAAAALVWTSRYDGPKHTYDYAWALAGSPDGSEVFVMTCPKP